MIEPTKLAVEKNGVAHRIFHTMGMTVHVTLISGDAERAAQAAQRVFDEWDRRCSRFRNDSELHTLNMSAGTPVRVSTELFSVIERCLELAKETGGIFDPSAGAYLAARGYGLPAAYVLPSPVPTWRDIKLNASAQTITCAPHQVLEPAAIVKGIAIDRAGKALQKYTPRWMINAGGDIRTQGPFRDAGQTAWNVAIQHPDNPAAVATIISIQDCAVATSGTYQTKWEWHGEMWQHQIQMQTGQPSESVKSLTVVCETAQAADEAASLGLLLGIQKGSELLNKRHVPYMYIDAHNAVFKNASFRALETTHP